MLQLPGVPFPAQVLLFLLMAKDIWLLRLVIEIILRIIIVTFKVKAWCNDVKRLAEVADIFPHAA